MAADYKNKLELMQALSPLDPAGRAAILANPDNRALALNSGSNVTMLELDGTGIENAFIYLVERKNRHGEKDGLGALGGLSERINMDKNNFYNMMQYAPLFVAELLASHTTKKDSYILKSTGVLHALHALDFQAIREEVKQNPTLENLKAILEKHLAGYSGTIRENLPQAIVFIIENKLYNPFPAMITGRGQELLIGGKDDLVVEGLGIKLTDKDRVIANNTVFREMAEELSEIGLGEFKISPERLSLVFSSVKDDGYITNSNGNGWQQGNMADAMNVYAVSPYCHIYKLSDEEIAKLRDTPQIEKGGKEIGRLIRVPLVEMLERFGKKDSDGKNDLSYNYKYCHEYIIAWNIASSILGNDEKELVELAKTVQANIYAKGGTHKIDFLDIAKTMGQDLDSMDFIISGSVSGITQKMQAAIDKVPPSKTTDKGGNGELASERTREPLAV